MNLFDFDYDLTFAVFFFDADERVYARYGSRASHDADALQSLAGLRSTMQSVLAMHGREKKEYAAKERPQPFYVRDIPNLRTRGCMHCHQVNEALTADLKRNNKWNRDLVYRYPPPETLGWSLEVDRGNTVKAVKEKSPAARAGLQPGDVLQKLHRVPVHSIADVQHALDRSPKSGTIPIVWKRGEKTHEGTLELKEGWRSENSLAWRPSLRRVIASARLSGTDLTAEEKQKLGLPPRQLAFRQKDSVPTQARSAGIVAGDVILGFDDKPLEMDSLDFLNYVRSHYLIGDKVMVNLIREGKRMNLEMSLIR